MNSRNNSAPRRARLAAGAGFCPAGGAEGAVFDPYPLRVRFRRGPKAKRFSCQIGRCPISGAGVFGPLADRAAWFAAIAQLVEHVIRNDGVTGSSPVCGTTSHPHPFSTVLLV